MLHHTPVFYLTFHPSPLLAMAGRKEDKVNQGAILRAFLPWGFFYFQEKEKMRQLLRMENGYLTNGISLCSN